MTLRRGPAGRARPARRGSIAAARRAAQRADARRRAPHGGRIQPTSFAAELVLAADQFLITPAGRVEDAARAHAAGDEVRTVIAGYHWFTDWGRDTMISLEGLTLATGRHAEAGYILRTFAHYVRDGLIPNMFPEGEQRGPLPHGRRDALVLPRPRPLPATRPATATRCSCCCRRCIDIVEHHLRGHALRHRRRSRRRPAAPGRRGLPAHLDGRQGRRLGGDAAARQGGRDQRALVQRPAAAGRLARASERRRTARRAATPRTPSRPARRSTSASGTTDGGYLYDVVDGEHGDDPALPAQPALRHLAATIRCSTARAGSRCWTSCSERLLTPVGLRSLAPGHPDYKPRYYGDLRARDAAYHQGTVWAWLIGPFIDAWLKVHPDDRAGRARLPRRASSPHLDEACIGIDQRDLRRRAAVHAARLHRPGLERRRGAARLGQDGRAG